MIFHGHTDRGSIFIVDVTKIDLLRVESDSVYRKAAQNTELNRQYLIGTHNFNRNPHRELLMRVSWRHFIIFLNQELVTSGKYRSIRFKLQPYGKTTITLNVSQSWIELQVWLEILGEEQLNLHRIRRPVEKSDLLPVKLVINEHIQIIFLFLDVDGHVHTLTLQYYGNGIRVVLIFQIECKLSVDLSEFVWYKGHLNLKLRVALN